MSDLDALLAGIVADPHNQLRWLVVADWLDDCGQPERAELLRLHRELIRTCCEPAAEARTVGWRGKVAGVFRRRLQLGTSLALDRGEWQQRVVELIDQGVKPCVPQHTLMLPGEVPLVGNFIPPGSFLMGSDVDDDEKPVHKVTLTKGFFLGIHPVTQAQWKAVTGTDPSHYKGDDRPVEMVSWNEAVGFFCANATELAGFPVRLPTEAEWEYACRAGTTTHFHFGDMPDAGRMNYCAKAIWNGSAEGEYRKRTTDVGTFAANPWGLFDCHGNAWEWCQDWYDEEYYGRSSPSDPQCEDSAQTCRTLRGGSWGLSPAHCRAACRRRDDPAGRDSGCGFRVVFCLD